MRGSRWWMALAVGVTMIGCNRSESSSTGRTAAIKGSCNNAPKGFCNEFTGSQYTAAQVQMACQAQGVAFAAGACPPAGLVGSCQVQAGAPLESHYRYYGSFPGGRAAAETQCKTLLRGAWTTP